MVKEFHKHEFKLSEKQVKRLLNGHTVQLKYHEMINGGVEILLEKKESKKVEKAKREKKGARVKVDPEVLKEVSVVGGKIHWGKIGHEISNFYNKDIKPTLSAQYANGNMGTAISSGLSMAGVPFSGAIGSAAASAGHSLGAYGIHRQGRGFGSKLFGMAKEKAKSYVKEHGREHLHNAIAQYAPASVQDLAHHAANVVGDHTGAYGLRKRRGRGIYLS